MTRGELLDFLTEQAKRYHKDALETVIRNRHMNDLTDKDIARIRRSKKFFQRFADALLVDFINSVGVGQNIDYGLYTKHLEN